MMQCTCSTACTCIAMGFGNQNMYNLGIGIFSPELLKLLPVIIGKIVEITNDLVKLLLTQIKTD